MKINGVTLKLDVADYHEMERYEKALLEAKEKMESISEIDSYSNVIKSMCHTIFDFFNKVFGDGTDREIFGDEVNLMVCIDAFESMISQVDSEKEKCAQKIAEKTKKYKTEK